MGARVVAACMAAVVGLGPSGAARAQEDPAYPAATCAALWTAHARTPLGPAADPLDYRDEAVRRSGNADAVDAYIATQTLRLTDLIYAYIDLADEHSRELFEGLLRTCERFAAETPEIAAPGRPRDPVADPSG